MSVMKPVMTGGSGIESNWSVGSWVGGGVEGEVQGVDLAVLAVRGAMMACSMVLGRADWVPGRTNPERGRPDWESGLRKEASNYYI